MNTNMAAVYEERTETRHNEDMDRAGAYLRRVGVDLYAEGVGPALSYIDNDTATTCTVEGFESWSLTTLPQSSLKRFDLSGSYVAPSTTFRTRIPIIDIATLNQGLAVYSDFSLPHNLLKRIRQLDAISRDEEDTPLSTQSVLGFYRFFMENNFTKLPSLFLTNEGNIRGEWRENRNRRIGIDFLDYERCFYVIFTPDIDRPGEILRASGNLPINRILEILDGYKVAEFFNL